MLKIALTICASTLGVSSLLIADEVKPEYLFVMMAKDSSITEVNNTYTLTLYDVDRNLAMFTDRPVRKGGLMKIEDFMALWSNSGETNSFAKDNPNASLVYVVNDQFKQVTITLKNPQYDHEHGRLTFEATVVGSDTMPMGSLGATALFIDNGIIVC